MPEIRAFRLLPVPMRRDDPRWHRSWWQKPCLVFEITEAGARAVASEYFSTMEDGDRASIGGHPWDTPDLVVCEERQIIGEPPGLAMVTNLAGEVIDRADSTEP